MILGRSNPIGALCILCHDADAVLPFYRDILGFEPRRAEESFYHFARRGTATALCLWEIGHVARHTVFTAHPENSVPSKFILSLTAASAAEVDALRNRLTSAGIKVFSDRSGSNAGSPFYFVDPCAVIWEVRVGLDQHPGGVTVALDRITLICRDFEATKAFYEDKLGFPASDATDGRVTYPPVDQTALSLWDAAVAASTVGGTDLSSQGPSWSATTAMLAYSFETIEQVHTLYKGLGAIGVSFDEAPAHFDWDFSACYFRDPEDNIWELFETPGNIEQRMLPQISED